MFRRIEVILITSTTVTDDTVFPGQAITEKTMNREFLAANLPEQASPTSTLSRRPRMASIHCQVVAPTGIVFEGDAASVKARVGRAASASYPGTRLTWYAWWKASCCWRAPRRANSTRPRILARSWWRGSRERMPPSFYRSHFDATIRNGAPKSAPFLVIEEDARALI